MEFGLLLIRLVVGLTMAAHGGQKLFGWFGGPGLHGTTAMMEHLGLHPARTQAFLAGLTEFGCGALLALGFLTPVASAGLVAVMVVAASTIHPPKGFFNANGGYELSFIISGVVVGLAFTGSGWFSLDRVLHLGLRGIGPGMFALALGLLSGGLQILIAGSNHPSTSRPG